MSAVSQLAGMFPVQEGIDVSKINSSFLVPPFPNPTQAKDQFALAQGQQPIPIHVQQVQDDKQLLGYGNACANSGIWQAKNRDDADWKRIESEFSDVFHQLNQTNIKKYFSLPENLDLDTISQLVDTLIAVKWAGDDYKNNEITKYIPGFNFTQEEMLEPAKFNTLWVQMSLLYNAQLHLALFKTKQQKSVSVTPFFIQLLTYFQNILNAPNYNYFKWIMLSAHDTTIAMVAQGLNLTSWECIEQVKLQTLPKDQTCIYTYPGFASNIIFELYLDKQKNPYIKALYNGTEQALCGTTDTFCYLDQFSQIITDFVVYDFDKVCGNPVFVETITSSAPTWAIVIIVIMSILLLLSLACFYLQRRKINQLSQYEKTTNYSTI